MRMIAAAYLSVGCATPENRISEKMSLSVSQSISISAGSGLALDEVTKRLKEAIYTSQGVSPAVIVEYSSGLDSTGKYSLTPSYSSLTALVSALEGQYSDYKWEILPGDIVFVRPSSSSYLASLLPAGNYNSKSFCDLLKVFGGKIFPNTKITRLTTCMYRGGAQYRENIPAHVLSNQAIFGKGSDPVFNVSVMKGDRVIDAIATAFDKFGFRFSAGVAPIMQNKGIPPTWILSF